MKTINFKKAIFASVGIIALASVCLLTSCHKENPTMLDQNATAQVKIHVSDFTIS